MKRIGFKLWAGMMALVVVGLLLLWFFQIVFLQSFYNNLKVSDIKKQSSQLAELYTAAVKHDYASADLQAFRTKADEFAYNNNLSIVLSNIKSDELYTAGTINSNGQMMMSQNSARIEAFQKALAGQTTITELVHPRFGNKFKLITIPINNAGAIVAVLSVNLPMAPVEDTAAILKKQLGIITVILLVASLLISFLISRSFTNPILEIKRVAMRMSSGDFSSRIQTTSDDEIGELAATINEMGAELSKLDQLQKDLIANVSHELRTPLSIIRGYAETIRDVTGEDGQKRDKQIGIIIEESERLKGLVDDILNLSLLQGGAVTLSLENFPLNELLQGVAKRYDLLCEKAGIKLMAWCDEQIWVRADGRKIEQVMYNLVNNAFNHTPNDGVIEIKATITAVAEKVVRIEISDTGAGISEQELKHIWGRFYQSEHGSGRKAIGTGLGLAIVKSVLESHGASYGATSSQGVGTTFWFELTLAECSDNLHN